MPGEIIRVAHRLFYDYSAVAAGSFLSHPIGAAVDVSQYREASLVVRIHNMFYDGNSSWRVDVFAEAPSSEDPAKDFITTSTVASTGLISMPASFGYLNEQTITPPFGAWLRVNAVAHLFTGTAFTMTFSVDIVGKS